MPDLPPTGPPGVGPLGSAVRRVGSTLRLGPAVAAYRRARRRGHTPPEPPPASYRYKAFEARRREQALRRTAGYRDPVWSANTKTAGRDLAVSLGIAVPEMYVRGRGMEKVDFDALPDAFVLKPVRGTRGRGCYVVRRAGDHYVRLTGGRPLSEAELRAGYARLLDQGLVSREVVVEELVTTPALPDAGAPDFRVFCFGSEVGLVVERSAGPDWLGRKVVRYRYWGPGWEDLGNVRPGSHVDPSLPAPHHPEELHRAALAVAGRFDRPHLRVDLYDRPAGVVFGELTPNPSQLKAFEPATDARLGRLWEEAEALAWARARRLDAAPHGPDGR